MNEQGPNKEDVRPDPRNAPLDEVIRHLEAAHDVFRQDAMPRLLMLAQEAVEAQACFYGAVLEVLYDDVAGIVPTLQLHFDREERELFPHVRSIEAAARRGSREPVDALALVRHEHENAADVLGRMRRLTGNYALPHDAGEAFAELYEALDAFENDLLEHIGWEELLVSRTVSVQRRMIRGVRDEQLPM